MKTISIKVDDQTLEQIEDLKKIFKEKIPGLPVNTSSVIKTCIANFWLQQKN